MSADLDKEVEYREHLENSILDSQSSSISLSVLSVSRYCFKIYSYPLSAIAPMETCATQTKSCITADDHS